MTDRSRLKLFSSCVIKKVDSFEGQGIKPEILKYIKESNVQIKLAHEYALSLILSQKSLLLISPPASGRSSVAIIGILNSIDQSIQCTQAIVLSPEKRLAEEFFEILKDYSKYTKFTTLLCVAGVNFDTSKLNAQIIVATCGTLLYYLKNNLVNLNYIKIIVCDIASKLFKEPLDLHTEKVLSYVINHSCVY